MRAARVVPTLRVLNVVIFIEHGESVALLRAPIRRDGRGRVQIARVDARRAHLHQLLRQPAAVVETLAARVRAQKVYVRRVGAVDARSLQKIAEQVARRGALLCRRARRSAVRKRANRRARRRAQSWPRFAAVADCWRRRDRGRRVGRRWRLARGVGERHRLREKRRRRLVAAIARLECCRLLRTVGLLFFVFIVVVVVVVAVVIVFERRLLQSERRRRGKIATNADFRVTRRLGDPVEASHAARRVFDAHRLQRLLVRAAARSLLPHFACIRHFR